jgi:hypothetical protein
VKGNNGHNLGTCLCKGSQAKASAREHWTREPVRPRLLPLKAAAQYLGLTVWALRERVWQGALPVVRFDGGRKMYLDVKDLDAFIERHKIIIQ